MIFQIRRVVSLLFILCPCCLSNKLCCKGDESTTDEINRNGLHTNDSLVSGSRCPVFWVRLLPKHRKISDSCDSGSDKKDTSGSGSTEKDKVPPTSSLTNPSAPTMYDSRKYGHNLPMDSVMPYFETLPCIPTGIFRCTAGECLGNGANKCTAYQNPEYFSFHHMTFYDMHLLLRCYRQKCPATGRKK